MGISLLLTAPPGNGRVGHTLEDVAMSKEEVLTTALKPLRVVVCQPWKDDLRESKWSVRIDDPHAEKGVAAFFAWDASIGGRRSWTVKDKSLVVAMATLLAERMGAELLVEVASLVKEGQP